MIYRQIRFRQSLLLIFKENFYSFNFPTTFSNNSSANFDEQQQLMNDDSASLIQFCSGNINDNNSSTTFSSRANTPLEESLNETVRI